MRSATATSDAEGCSTGGWPRIESLSVWLGVLCIIGSLALRFVYLWNLSRVDAAEHPASIAAEGVVGIMALHILNGARPVFYYGQYYMGALEGYLAAGVFRLAGESMAALRVVPALFAVAWIPLTMLITCRLFGKRAGWLAGALVALPSPFVFAWGFQARGGHAEHVTLFLVALLLCVRCIQGAGRSLVWLGLVAGFALWVNQLFLAYLPVFAAAIWVWARPARKDMVAMLVAFVVGISPLLYGNIVEPLCTVRAMASKVRASWTFRERQMRQRSDDDEARFYRGIPLLQIVGAQRRRDGAWSPLGVAAALIVVVGAMQAARRARAACAEDPVRGRGVTVIVACIGVTLLVGIAGFSGQPVGRYQLVLSPLLAMVAAGGLDLVAPALAVPLVGFVAVTMGVETLLPPAANGRTPPDHVARVLLDHGLTRGYGADNMYDLVFVTAERLIIEPLEWTRYRPYREAVETSPRVFYLFRDDQRQKTSFLALMGRLKERDARYRQLDIGEYRVLYDFEPADVLSPQAVQQLREEVRKRKGR